MRCEHSAAMSVINFICELVAENRCFSSAEREEWMQEQIRDVGGLPVFKPYRISGFVLCKHPIANIAFEKIKYIYLHSHLRTEKIIVYANLKAFSNFTYYRILGFSPSEDESIRN